MLSKSEDIEKIRKINIDNEIYPDI